MALTVSQKITIAKISQYLCAIDIERGGTFGGGIDQTLPLKLYNIRKSVENQYILNPADTTLTATSNYLYALCNKYALMAQTIVLGSGGSVPGTVATVSPTPYQFTVDASTSFMINGQSSKTITAFIGYNLIFIRGGVTQSTVNDGINSYYSWSKSTGIFTCSPAAVTSELFGLFPI